MNKFIGNWKLEIGSSLRSKSGFTQIELLLSMGILMILISVLTTVFGQILDVQLESQAISSIDQNGRYVMARLMYDMQRAQNIALPASIGDQTNTLQININSIDYVYSLNNGDLKLTADSQINNLNNDTVTVSNLTFTRIGDGENGDTVRVGFTLTSKVQQVKGNEQKNFQTTLGLQ